MHETSAPVAEAPAATPYVYNGTELYHIDQFLQYAQSAEASDVHLCTGAAPTWRRNGNLEPMFPDAAPLEPEHTWMIALSFLTPEQAAQVTGRGDIDFAYEAPYGRFRTSVVKQRLGTDLVFRIIYNKLRTLADLGLPDSLKSLTQFHNGLVLVTGPVGSGKSTTLAALIEQLRGVIKVEDSAIRDVENKLKAAGESLFLKPGKQK